MTTTTITIAFASQCEPPQLDAALNAPDTTPSQALARAAKNALGDRASIACTRNNVSISGPLETLQRDLRIKVSAHGLTVAFQVEGFPQLDELFIIPAAQYAFVSGLSCLLDTGKRPNGQPASL